VTQITGNRRSKCGTWSNSDGYLFTWILVMPLTFIALIVVSHIHRSPWHLHVLQIILSELESSWSDLNMLKTMIALVFKMTTEGPYEPLTTPARCILGILPSTPNASSELRSSGSTDVQQHTNPQTARSTEINTYHNHREIPQSSPLPSPSKLYSTNSDIECIGSSSQAKLVPEVQLQVCSLSLSDRLGRSFT
jgi:hypothetical protein